MLEKQFYDLLDGPYLGFWFLCSSCWDWVSPHLTNNLDSTFYRSSIKFDPPLLVLSQIYIQENAAC